MAAIFLVIILNGKAMDFYVCFCVQSADRLVNFLHVSARLNCKYPIHIQHQKAIFLTCRGCL